MKAIRFISLALCLIAVMGVANAATTYTVGDSYGWNVPPGNSSGYYDQWSSNHTFVMGDSLVFNWNGTHTATQVATKGEYDNCTKLGIILVDSGVIQTFNENGTYYFLCSVGTHCEQGQKVTIKIGNGISPSNAAPSLTVGAVSAVLSVAIVFFLTYM